MAMYLGTKRNPKNLIPFPYYNSSATRNGITFTVNDDGTVTINGTPTVATVFEFSVKTVNLKSNTTYSLSGIPKGMNDNGNKFYFNISAYKDGVIIKNFSDIGDGIVFTCADDYVSSLTLWIGAGTTVDNITLKPMINEGTKAEPYTVGQAVKILAPSINLFDKSLIHLTANDFANCSEYEVSVDYNTIIARGTINEYVTEFSYSKGWVRPSYGSIVHGAKGVSYKKGDIVIVSADFTLIEQGNKSAGVRCYLCDFKNSSNDITLVNQQSISATKQRLTWKFTAIGDGDGYYPCFPINSNKVKIENITMQNASSLWRIRSGVNMGRNPKNLIPFPYKDGNYTSKGITWTVNDDGTVMANGTATETCSFALSVNANFLKPNTKYVYSAVPKGVNGDPFNYYAYIQANKNGAWYAEYGEIGNGTVFTAENDCEFFIYLWIRAGTVVNNVTFKPMLNEGTKALPYYYYD